MYLYKVKINLTVFTPVLFRYLKFLMGGIQRVPELLAHYPNLSICIISASKSCKQIRRALDHGASGYIPKIHPPQETMTAIKKILPSGLFVPNEAWVTFPKNMNTGVTLSLQQIEIIEAMSQRKSNKVIALELKIAEGTVKQHASNIFKLLNVNNRTLAIQQSRDLSLLS